MQDMTSLFEIKYSRTIFNRRTRQQTTTVTITNTSPFSITGVLHFSIDAITVPSTEWLNLDGVAPQGYSFKDLTPLLEDDQLLPGQALGEFSVVFSNPTRARFSFDAKIFLEDKITLVDQSSMG